MGTRAQVKIEDTGVYLYQHWDGDNLKNIVKTAMKKKWRWNDEEYLTRIIFSEMIKDHLIEETGYGIGTDEHCDLDYLIIINCEKQTIKILEIWNNEEKKYSFDEFIKS